jgi:hypothetical protein
MYLSVRVTESNIMVFPTTYYKLCKCYNFQRACGNYSRHTTQPLLRILVYRKRPVEQFGGSQVQSSDHNFDFCFYKPVSQALPTWQFMEKRPLFSAASTSKCILRLTSLILSEYDMKSISYLMFCFYTSYLMV